MKKYGVHWLFSVLVLTLIFGVVYKVSQINLDHSLYAPLAHEAVNKAWQGAFEIEAGEQPEAPATKVNLEIAHNPFVSYYDQDKNLISSSAVIDDQTPTLPENVFDNTMAFSRDYFSWQPKEGVNVAAVAASMGPDKGIVVIGQKRQVADYHLGRLKKTILIGWLTGLILLTTSFVLISHRRR